MTDNNKDIDKLLDDFFAANRHEVADGGFTHRVMRRIPQRRNRLALMWNVLCFLLVAALFIALDGVQLVWVTLQETFIGLMEQSALADAGPVSWLIAAGVLIVLACRKIVSLA